MKKMKTVLSTVGIVIAASSLAQAESKLGFVDMPKAVQSTVEGKKIKTELETEFKKRKKDLDKKEADLKKMGQDLAKRKSTLSDEVLKQKETELQRELLKFQDEVAQNQNEISKRQQELTGPILEKMQRVIAKVSKEKGFTLVLQNSQAVLYTKPELDFTQDVVKAFNKEKK